jgi:hypothetical protein
MHRRHALALVLIATHATGCAAVFKGGRQDVTFRALPEGADVSQDGRYLGAAPTTASIDRDRPPNITVSAPGHADGHVYLQKKADTPWFFWDIATCVVPVTLCIPVLVDAISGAWYSYEDSVTVKLAPLPAHAPSAAPARPVSASAQ